MDNQKTDVPFAKIRALLDLIDHPRPGQPPLSAADYAVLLHGIEELEADAVEMVRLIREAKGRVQAHISKEEN